MTLVVDRSNGRVRKMSAVEAEQVDELGAVAPHSLRATYAAMRSGAMIILDRHAETALLAAQAKRARKAMRG